MTKVLQMKYLKFDPRGQYRYRRRVPKNLVKALGKREFIKVLARDEDEAFLEYPKYHKFVERLISGTHQNATSLDPKAIMETVHTVLSQAGFDLSDTVQRCGHAGGPEPKANRQIGSQSKATANSSRCATGRHRSGGLL
jgi:hypothetical protein